MNEDGNGTISSPYIIRTAAQLADLSIFGSITESTYYKLGNNIDLSEYDQNSVWLGGSGWKPLEFIGQLDGNFKKITGLYINSNNEFLGLIENIGSDSEVKNLFVENGSITANLPKSNIKIGMLCGSSKGNIYNCAASGEIYCGPGENIYIGGLLGTLSGENKECAFCYSNVNIKIGTPGNLKSSYFGGIVGYMYPTNYLVQTYATGNILLEVISTSTFANCAAGGICGYINEQAQVDTGVALNTKIITDIPIGYMGGIPIIEPEDLSIHRVVGHNSKGQISKCFGLETMQGNDAWISNPSGNDGDDISMIEVLNDPSIGYRFNSNDGWVIITGQLPTFPWDNTLVGPIILVKIDDISNKINPKRIGWGKYRLHDIFPHLKGKDRDVNIITEPPKLG